MKTVHVNASRQYDILIGSGLIRHAGVLAAKILSPCKAAIITDEHVAPLYLSAAEQSFASAGFAPYRLVLPPGEGSKSIAAWEEILNFLCREQITKSDVVVALGGGVIGDAAGFAASAFLRGIPYIQLPTTFLAAVDSSVGGKTAINLSSGKNLAGAFCQPHMVICDTDTLTTLPPEIYADGVSEAIKYGLIGSKLLFSTLRLGMKKEIAEDIIAQCVAMKANFVAHDEFDDGTRQLLNFGHTIGHAVEKCSNYSLSHGQAVAIGMAYVSRAAWHRKLSRENCTPALTQALQNNGLPQVCNYTAEELAGAALSDKKRRGDTLTLILPERIGHCYRYSLPVTELASFIRDGMR